ncbi:hypothetical protein A4X03_0g9053 [Tilletia caries]|uniref:Uncharacterized protein n=1 Tax=Tilletia caries TaxID=13290 RepID=A0A8T8SE15_9BASI|nr:hypothetical protein A4X03_0g9053 [Tilletia caries]
MLSQLPDRPGPPVALATGAGAVAMVVAKVPPAQRSNKQSSLPLVASLAHLPLSRPQALHHASAHAMKPPIPDTIAPSFSLPRRSSVSPLSISPVSPRPSRASGAAAGQARLLHFDRPS